VYTQKKDKYENPPVSQKTMQIYYYTMQLYLQNSSNLQTINVQVKQCNMLRYTAPLKETFKFAQRLNINMPRIK